jgi:hypothetical protein
MVAYFVARRVEKLFAPNFLLSSVYLGSGCGFVALIALWSTAAFSLLRVVKLLQPR